jgi:hypothetical protein
MADNMLDRFNTTDKPRPKAARDLLAHPVNFIDQLNAVQNEFTVNRAEKLGQRANDTTLTDFTATALAHYNDELKMAATSKMDNFVPIEPGTPLNRWTPKTAYLASKTGAPGANGANPR